VRDLIDVMSAGTAEPAFGIERIVEGGHADFPAPRSPVLPLGS
jgi:hypothetical protein